jgi:hypothetical protein
MVVALVPTCVAAVLLRGEAFFSAFPRQFYCNLADSAVTRGTFAGPMLAVAIPGILFSRMFSCVFLCVMCGGQSFVFFVVSRCWVLIFLWSHCALNWMKRGIRVLLNGYAPLSFFMEWTSPYGDLSHATLCLCAKDTSPFLDTLFQRYHRTQVSALRPLFSITVFL